MEEPCVIKIWVRLWLNYEFGPDQVRQQRVLIPFWSIRVALQKDVLIPLIAIQHDPSKILTSSSLRNLGVILRSDLPIVDQIRTTSHAADNYNIRLFVIIRASLS